MGAVAAYIMRGRWQAILSAVALALVSLLLMPLGWLVSFFSAACLGLVTLVQGQREGMLCLIGSAFLLGVLGMVFSGTPVLALFYALLVWFPVWFLATVLGRTVALNTTLLLSAAFGVLVVVLFYALLDSPPQWWYAHFVDVVLPALEEAGVVIEDKAALSAAFAQSSRMMTGTLAAFLVSGAYLGLMLARRWQAVLYNPGGFQQEFHGLRFGKTAAMLVLAVLAVSMAGLGVISEVALGLMQVMVIVFLLQGLAVGHALVKQYGANQAWLVAMYVMLVFVIPYAMFMFALTGIVDNWFDFRQRFAKQQ